MRLSVAHVFFMAVHAVCRANASHFWHSPGEHTGGSRGSRRCSAVACHFYAGCTAVTTVSVSPITDDKRLQTSITYRTASHHSAIK